MGWFGKGKKTVVVAGNSWDVYSYRYGQGQRAFIRFDVAAAKEEQHRGHGNCRRVVMFIDPAAVRADGMPAKEKMDMLAAFEDDLVRGLTDAGVDCRLVGCMTYGGLREFVFQVEDTAAFADVVAPRVGARGGERVELRESAGWDFFDAKVRPSRAHWRSIANRQVIGALVKAGSNPEKPHMLEHVFIGPEAALREIASQLESDGFRTISGEGERLVLAKPALLDLDEISELTGALEGFSASLGVEYDGWGTAVIS